jgi:hypothetical protein
MFFFQLPWLPEFVFGLNDFEALEMNMRGGNMGVRTEYVTSEDIEAYKYNYSSKSDCYTRYRYAFIFLLQQRP